MHLFFDLDGTLTDPGEGIRRSIRHACEQLGAPLPADAPLDWCIGPPLQESFPQLLGAARAHLADQAIRLYRERYAGPGMFENRVYENIPPCLAALEPVATLHVVTSKPRTFAVPILEHFGLAGRFASVHGAELDGTNADKGDLIRAVLGRKRISPDEAVMIGDRSHDMMGARKNGVAAYGVTWGYGSPEELRAAGARRLFDHPAELADWVIASIDGGDNPTVRAGAVERECV